MRFYIADCHFYHEALNTKMDKRGFASAEQMNEYMIQRWNEKVRNCDETVILGDFSFGDAMQTNSLLKHDNGRKVILSHYPIMCYNGQYRLNENGEPKTYMLYGHVHDTRDELLIDHFIRATRQTSFLDFEGKEKMIPCCMINCFCVFSDYVPLTLDEWIENDQMRRRQLTEKFSN